ncbi:MAG: NADP-dependent malic enzyme [Myxococcota bacterium]|nr:NADP-dependent malic enzyme [Myxococcota bacterium]
MFRIKDALNYHADGRPGKIEVTPSKPCQTQRDLSLAYTPGVAEPCRRIAERTQDVYKYTAKGNLVAVVTNGTAVLGLGDIGPEASKPVMEGKGVLFKQFADIDVFDIELKADTVDEMVNAIVAMAPTFGGINLEDIRSPECFEVEEILRERLDIPVFHDDQHGTAIIAGAALLNAAHLQGKELSELKTVVSGAGAAAIACVKFMIELGLRAENIIMCDSKGVLKPGRERMTAVKEPWARDVAASTVGEALEGADFFLGLSVPGVCTAQDLKTMAERPIIFVLANPDPEVPYAEVVAACPDAVIATGRSDHPNQVNNVLGFPYIFRGALDCQATGVSEAMKLAAARALAHLAREEVPDSVSEAYGVDAIKFGANYIIPKPFDPRVLFWVAPDVAQAAVDEGIARVDGFEKDQYREALRRRVSPTHAVLSTEYAKARRYCPTMTFVEGEEGRMIHAAVIARDEGICQPRLLGRSKDIKSYADEHNLDLDGIEIVEPWTDDRQVQYIENWFQKSCRRGATRNSAEQLAKRRRGFGMLQLECGDTDALICGISDAWANYMRPALEVVGVAPGVRRAAGMYMLVMPNTVKFICDATVNIDPDDRTLAEIAILASDMVRSMDIEPRVAMLSYANFGAVKDESSRKIQRAVQLVREQRPDLEIDGEMQVDTALSQKVREQFYPFTELSDDANVLVMPNLAAANITYKILQQLSNAEVVGPILLGMDHALTIMQRGASVAEIVNMTAITAVQYGTKSRRHGRVTLPPR